MTNEAQTPFTPPPGVVRLWNLPDWHVEVLMQQDPDASGFFHIGITNLASKQSLISPGAIAAHDVARFFRDLLPGALVDALANHKFTDMTPPMMEAAMARMDATDAWDERQASPTSTLN